MKSWNSGPIGLSSHKFSENGNKPQCVPTCDVLLHGERGDDPDAVEDEVRGHPDEDRLRARLRPRRLVNDRGVAVFRALVPQGSHRRPRVRELALVA